MSNRILDSQIQSRNDTAANWSSVNPVLLKGRNWYRNRDQEDEGRRWDFGME